MDAHRRTLTLRRVAMMAALAALAVPAGPAEAAKKRPQAPVITSVSPMKATVGQTLTLKGRNFRKGKGRNSVGFKRDGQAVVFVKSDISTKRMLTVKIPPRLEKQLADGPARFHLRVLAGRFGRAFTPDRLSPTIAARPTVAAPIAGVPGDAVTSAAPAPPDPGRPEADCDGDGSPNGADDDDDADLLSDALENALGTDGCKTDTDGDKVADGYEHRSAVDLNDDEYGEPNRTLPGPVPTGYPNPLLDDAGIDYDGDGLSLALEHDLWSKTSPPLTTLADADAVTATPLTYSDGLQYSVSKRCGPAFDGAFGECGGGHAGRRVPALVAAEYPNYKAFEQWLTQNGYDTVWLHDADEWFDHAAGRHPYNIRDVDRSRIVEAAERVTLDGDADRYLSDDERDEDADGLSNYSEYLGQMRPDFWASCYQAEKAYPGNFVGTDPTKRDSDGDGVIDAADDQDHDDVPNVMELSRMAASHLDDTDDRYEASVIEGEPPPTPTTGGGPLCKPDKELNADDEWHPDAYGQVHPFNPCMPDRRSRNCGRTFPFGTMPAPFDGPDWWSLQ